MLVCEHDRRDEGITVNKGRGTTGPSWGRAGDRRSAARGRRLTRGLVATTIAAVAVVALALPAVAAPPLVDEGEFDQTYVVPAEAFPCGVEVTFHEVGSYRFTAFRDADGTIVREQGTIGGTTTITSAYGQIVNHWREVGTLDPAAGTITWSGNSYNIHGGAGGVLVNASGHWIEDATTGERAFLAGPHDDPEANIDAVCAVLAP
jgi:hypothetical protein